MSEQNPYEAPQDNALDAATGVAPIQVEGDATGGVIPYKNPAALAAYYLSIIGLFPILGIFASIPAFVLGIMGIRARNRNPKIKGSVHAWIGIILGFITTLANLSCIGLGIIAAVADASR